MSLVAGPVTAFVKLVQDNIKENIVIVEVGCFQGETTVWYAPLVKKYNGRIIVIDWFHGAAPDLKLNSETPHSHNPNSDIVFNHFMENIRAVGCEDIVDVIRGKSHDVSNLIKDESVDIMFIDADHRYSNVSKDIELYQPKVKRGGILCGHDCEDINMANQFTPQELEEDYARSRFHAGVIQAVYDKFGKDIEILGHHDMNINGLIPQTIPIWIKRL